MKRVNEHVFLFSGNKTVLLQSKKLIFCLDCFYPGRKWLICNNLTQGYIVSFEVGEQKLNLILSLSLEDINKILFCIEMPSVYFLYRGNNFPQK